MKRNKKRAVISAFFWSIILIVSMLIMGRRVQHFQENDAPALYYYKHVEPDSFTYADRDVTLVQVQGENGTPDHILITYGDSVLDLPVAIAPLQPLPELLTRHADWLVVLRFAAAEKMSQQALSQRVDRGQIQDRLAIVTRTPRPGANPQTWGQVWRKDWTFDFYEFLPEGGFTHEKLGYPTTKRYEKAKADEIQEGTWQFGAALNVMPRQAAPAFKFTNDGVSAMGWTLPVASISVLGLTISITLAAAPARSTANTNAKD